MRSRRWLAVAGAASVGVLTLGTYVAVGSADTAVQDAQVVLAQAIDAQQAVAVLKPLPEPDFVVLGGGAKNFVITRSSRLDERTVVLNAKVTTWSKVGQVQRDRTVFSTPSNELLVTSTVVRTDTGWHVSELTWEFAPGSQP